MGLKFLYVETSKWNLSPDLLNCFLSSSVSGYSFLFPCFFSDLPMEFAEAAVSILIY